MHLKLDTGMGRWGLAELADARPRGRRADEPLRLRRLRRRPSRSCRCERFRAATARHSQPDPSHREQRRRAPLSGRPLRRGSLRHRALRHLALRHRPGRGRARACAPLGVRARPGRGCCSRASRPGYGRRCDRRAADVDRDRPGWLRGRLPARPDRNGGTRRGRAAPGRRHDLDGRLRGGARPAAAGRERR